jgi:outer membrane receptor for ferric coprogen and ferric-rhodotorulic acid
MDLANDRLKVMLGARHNQLRETLAWDSLPVIAPADRLNQDRVTPQVGALFKFNPEWSAFVSYSESLESQNRIDAFGNVSGPIEGRGYELGIKADAFNNALSATISVFEVERTNTSSRDLNREALEGVSPLFFFGNTDTSQGLEVDLAYNPKAHWQVLFTYAWLWRREVTGAQDPARIGRIFEQTPEHAVNVWTKYRFTEGRMRGLELGGGVRWDDGYFITPLIESGASHRFDLMARYPLAVGRHTLELTLNVTNITDERNLGGSINWTNPREFTLSCRLAF